MEESNYFKVGTREQPYISNSSLNYISPENGGSPQAFLSFFDEKQEAEKSYFKMGHLIHKWQEDRKEFLISLVNKPSDKLGEVADCAEAILKERRTNLEEEYKNDSIEQDVVFEDADYDDAILKACRILSWHREWGDAAIIKNASPLVKPYLQEIQKAENSKCIYISQREAEVVENCVKSIENHPIAKDLLFMQDTDFSNKKVYKELEIYWSKEFITDKVELVIQGRVLMFFKAKLDSLVIDFDNKIVTYTDPKTTSQGAYSFGKSFLSYKYYRQQAFYNWAIREWAKQNNIDLTGFTFHNYNIVIETSSLFQTVVYKINDLWLDKGRSEYQALIKRLVEHTATNQWNYSLEEVNNNLILDIQYQEEK